MRVLVLLVAMTALVACTGKPVGAPKEDAGTGGSAGSSLGGSSGAGAGDGGQSGGGVSGSGGSGDAGASGAGAAGMNGGDGGAGNGGAGNGGSGDAGASGSGGSGGTCSAQCVSGCDDDGLCIPVMIYRGSAEAWLSRASARLDGDTIYLALRIQPLAGTDHLDILAVPTMGGEARLVAENLRLDSYVETVPLTVDGSDVYFPAQNKLSAALRLFVVPKSGGSPTELGDVPDTWPSDIVHDATHLYWLTDDVGVYRMAKSGGEAELVAPGVGMGSRLLLDGATLIWGRHDAGIVVLQTLGQLPSSVSGEADSTCGLFGSASELFWAECWWPYRVYSNRSGTAVEVARAADPEPSVRPSIGDGAVAADGTSLYFLEYRKLNKLPLSGGTPLAIGSTIYPDDATHAADHIVGVDDNFVYLQGRDRPALMRLPK